MFRVWNKFRRMCVSIPQHIAGVFNRCQLHAQANTEERFLLLPSITDRFNFPFNPAVAEAAWYKYPIYIMKQLGNILCIYLLRINPFHLYIGIKGITGMLQCFNNRNIGILKLYVFANKADTNFSRKIQHTIY